MPEGPEVKIIVNNISDKFKGSELLKININSGRYSRNKKPDGYLKFIKNLPLKIKNFNTKGKFIWITLDNDLYIWITFGLTGILTTQIDKHSHITFETSKGNFYFDDVRNFGTIKFSDNPDELNKKLKTLGMDPLNNSISNVDCIKIFRKVNQNKIIALVLINQKIFSGIGNYLRADILYHAKISPYRELKNLSDQDLLNLCKSIQYIINKSYNKQQKNGLHTYSFLVYKNNKTKKGEDIKFDDLEGRTIWWAPSVQN